MNHNLRPHAVYYLRDPETQEIRWVGSTVNPIQRLWTHRSAFCNEELAVWIAGLPESPILEVQCWVQDKQEGVRVEVALTTLLRQRGVRLLNRSNGYCQTEETRRRKSIAVQAACTPQRCLEMSVAAKAAWTLERRARQRTAYLRRLGK